MTEVIVYDLDVARCLDIVKELRTYLQQHVDFEYAFYQGGYDWEMQEQKPYKTIFKFAKPADATAFSLKYL